MVSPATPRAFTRRPARFLRPRATSTSGAALSRPQVLRELFSQGLVWWWPPAVRFHGWGIPLFRWVRWVEKLRPVHGGAWRSAGIQDAILASACEVHCDPTIIFGLLECWCPSTNTFFFPWPASAVADEATVTLEDLAVLGGFPALGGPVRTAAPLAGESKALQLRMVAEHRGFLARNSTGPLHSEWMDRFFVDDAEPFIEHVAFLSLWLSRYVFPAPPAGTVGRHVFPIAVRLALGTKIALAPTILAGIYRDLSMLRRRAIAGGTNTAVVWAPFQILQLWAWERFRFLRPPATIAAAPKFLRPGEPRAKRWHSLESSLDLEYVRTVLQSPDNFQWRPYMADVDDWRHPSFHRDDGRWVTLSASDREEEDGNFGLRSFARWLRASELVGLDCVEQYAPHRVAMQFGLDQDLPACFLRANDSWELAWSIYDRDDVNVKVYVPPRLSASGVSRRFFDLRKQSVLGDGDSSSWVVGKNSPVQGVGCRAEQQEGALVLSKTHIVEPATGRRKVVIKKMIKKKIMMKRLVHKILPDSGNVVVQELCEGKQRTPLVLNLSLKRGAQNREDLVPVEGVQRRKIEVASPGKSFDVKPKGAIKGGSVEAHAEDAFHGEKFDLELQEVMGDVALERTEVVIADDDPLDSNLVMEDDVLEPNQAVLDDDAMETNQGVMDGDDLDAIQLLKTNKGVIRDDVLDLLVTNRGVAEDDVLEGNSSEISPMEQLDLELEGDMEDDTAESSNGMQTKNAKASLGGQLDLEFQVLEGETVETNNRETDCRELFDLKGDVKNNSLEMQDQECSEVSSDIDLEGAVCEHNSVDPIDEEFDYDQFVIEELEKVIPPCKSKFVPKKSEDEVIQLQKDLEFDREMDELKAEIARLQATLLELESKESEKNDTTTAVVASSPTN